jgi:hypothetical protein
VCHHQVETRILEKSHILQCGHQEWGNEISFYNFDLHIAVYVFSPIFYFQPDNGPLRKGSKHVVDFFNNLKIQLCYDGH